MHSLPPEIANRKFRISALITSIALFFFAACAGIEKGSITDQKGWAINRELLPHIKDKFKKVELFWTKPSEEGRHPVILFIHGHQEIRSGGESFAKTGRLGIMASRGYVAAAVSQPGYGYSDGPPDYCGPFSQEAVLTAIEFLRNKPFVNPHQVVLYGYSRGAMVASMVAAKDQKLAALILGGGAYDFFKWYPTSIPGINTYIEREAGTSRQAFRERSAIYHVDKIRAPILLLHGAKDERVPVQQATSFAEKLKAQGIPCKLVIFPNAGHAIPYDEQFREIYPFLQSSLR